MTEFRRPARVVVGDEDFGCRFELRLTDEAGETVDFDELVGRGLAPWELVRIAFDIPQSPDVRIEAQITAEVFDLQ